MRKATSVCVSDPCEANADWSSMSEFNMARINDCLTSSLVVAVSAADRSPHNERDRRTGGKQRN